MKLLKMIQEGKLFPDFPPIDNPILSIVIGGEEAKTTFYY